MFRSRATARLDVSEVSRRSAHRGREFYAPGRPIFVGLGPHDELQQATGGNLIMSNPGTRQRLPIEFGALDVRVVRRLILSRDRKLRLLVPLLVQMKRDSTKQWTSEDVDSISGTYRIEPHRAKDVPC